MGFSNGDISKNPDGENKKSKYCINRLQVI